MKKFLSTSLSLVALAITMSSCSSCYSKLMEDTKEGLTVSCSPEVLTLKGDYVTGDITVTIPAESFHANGVLKVTPVLVSATTGKREVGEVKFLQGEEVTDNYTVISSETGGSYTQTVQFPFSEEFRLSEVVLVIEAKCIEAGKESSFTEYETEIPVAIGTSTTQLLADNYAQVSIAPDAFKRVTNIKKDAQIMFNINSSVVRTKQLNSAQIDALEQFILDNSGYDRRTVSNVYTQSYASPDGPIKLNDKLSAQRGKTTQRAVARKFKRAKLPTSTKFDINFMGEDWEGFKELIEQSDIQDKELILQVLSMYSDPVVRDKEIQNMTATFKVLAEQILPELRRSKMSVNVEIQGLTDDELKATVVSDVNALNVEEMLYAATLYSDNATKTKIYLACANKYNDFRAWNNLGVVKAWEGNYSSAATDFEKASQIDNTNAQVINNLGVVALASGDKELASKLFASSNTPEAKYNKGLVELANGNYATAISSLNGYNKALAQYMNGDVTASKSTLSNQSSWRANYLKAVIAAREGNGTAVVSNLDRALEQNNEEVTALADTDINFIKFFNEPTFVEIVKVKPHTFSVVVL